MYEIWQLDRQRLVAPVQETLAAGRLEMSLLSQLVVQGAHVPVAFANGFDLNSAFNLFTSRVVSPHLQILRPDYDPPAFGDLFVDRSSGDVFVFTGASAKLVARHPLELVTSLARVPHERKLELRFATGPSREMLRFALAELGGTDAWTARAIVNGRTGIELERSRAVRLVGSLLSSIKDERDRGALVHMASVFHRIWVGAVEDVVRAPTQWILRERRNDAPRGPFARRLAMS